VLEVECESGLQVRLVEAWKGHTGVHRHEQGVEVFVAVVPVFVARDGFAGESGVAGERESEGVRAGDRGKIQVTVLQLCGYRPSVQRGGPKNTIAIVDGEIAGGSAFERESLGARYGRLVFLQRERELIAEV
jgi:hypothetical protein